MLLRGQCVQRVETSVIVNPANGAVLARINPHERDGTRLIQDPAAHLCGQISATGNLSVANPDGEPISSQTLRFQKIERETMRVTAMGETIATIQGHLPGTLR